MDIPLNADVHCKDGRCGRSTFIILNPVAETITHLVVRESWPSRAERLVPVQTIAATAREVIVLDLDREQFSQLEPFVQTSFVYTDVPHYASDPNVTMLWPYVVPAKRVVNDTRRQVPLGEMALRRGARVRATDGRAGRVDEFLIEPESGQISHLIMREGHRWGNREVFIPVAHIARIEEGLIELDLNQEQIAALPEIPVVRTWR